MKLARASTGPRRRHTHQSQPRTGAQQECSPAGVQHQVEKKWAQCALMGHPRSDIARGAGGSAYLDLKGQVRQESPYVAPNKVPCYSHGVSNLQDDSEERSRKPTACPAAEGSLPPFRGGLARAQNTTSPAESATKRLRLKPLCCFRIGRRRVDARYTPGGPGRWTPTS